ncbi:hypothetical protein G9P44_003620 [Scheffersomyces stipitis]|nr:hypothetical protein G9P44_003620 [Scheffersomyces stipitis]
MTSKISVLNAEKWTFPRRWCHSRRNNRQWQAQQCKVEENTLRYNPSDKKLDLSFQPFKAVEGFPKQSSLFLARAAPASSIVSPNFRQKPPAHSTSSRYPTTVQCKISLLGHALLSLPRSSVTNNI